MEFDRSYFQNKVAAVTGAASGIGLALAEELLASGAAKVVLADFNQQNLQQHVQRLSQQYPGRVKGILCDVTAEQNVRQMVIEAAQFGGRLDLLINCAGAGLAYKFTQDPPLAADNPIVAKTAANSDWEKGFALNFFGPLYGSRAAIEVMLKQGEGQIVNIISGIAFSPMAYQSMYAATKSALNALTLSLRAEYADYNIKFNSATPGTTATAIFDQSSSVPAGAQSPHQSAQRILNGVANNDRLILGDDGDLEGAHLCFFPDDYGRILDKVFLHFARQRRAGLLNFQAAYEDDGEVFTLHPLIDAIKNDEPQLRELMEDYLAQRQPTKFEEDYYQNKTALVTGGASGIGLALCEKLLSLGAKKVALADYNPRTLAAESARLQDQYPGRAEALLCNVSDENSVQAMVEKAAGLFDGRIDLVINCAGIGSAGQFTPTPDSEKILSQSGMQVASDAEWRKVFAINFYGTLYVCRTVIPYMLKQRAGQVVNIISGTAFLPMPYQSVYASAKAALNALTLVLRYEYWDDGIVFNSATPGTTATAIFAGAPIPTGAQTPRQSALRVLAGAAKNERLILGDDEDTRGAMSCYYPLAQAELDALFNKIARSRRGGNPTDFGRA